MSRGRNPDRIDVVVEFWDVPREGVATYEAQPHYFKAEFDDELDDYSGTYVLLPLDATAAAVVRDQWAKWLRWRQESSAGGVCEREPPRASDSLAELAATITQSACVAFAPDFFALRMKVGRRRQRLLSRGRIYIER